MPYKRVCKIVQIRPKRGYKVRDLVRIVGYVDKSGVNNAFLLAAIVQKMGLLEKFCVLSVFLKGLKGFLSVIATFSGVKVLMQYIDWLIQFLAAKDALVLLKRTRLYLIIAAVIALLVAVKELLGVIDAIGVSADVLSDGIDLIVEICSVGDAISSGIITY